MLSVTATDWVDEVRGVAVMDSITDCRLLYHGVVKDESAAILLRARVSSVGRRMGISPLQQENMNLVAGEMISNQLKHAKSCGIIQLWLQPGPVLDLFALDYGPGIRNLALAWQDHFSTTHTLGKGLGSIARLSDESAVYAQQETFGVNKRWNGTAILARFRLWHTREKTTPRNTPSLVESGLFFRALSDGRYNGDRVYFHHHRDRLLWLHLDGLGHGEVAQNTTANLGALLLYGLSPEQLLMAVDQQLHGSRGAVAITGEIGLAAKTVQITGVGDMCAKVFGGEVPHTLAFSPGVLGREHKVMSHFQFDIGNRCLVVTASDGIRRNWDESRFPGLFSHSPQLIAYILGNTMGRFLDDQSVCVVRANNP